MASLYGGWELAGRSCAPVVPDGKRCVAMGGASACPPSCAVQPCEEFGRVGTWDGFWTAGWQRRPFEAAGDAPSAKEAWRAVGLADGNPRALAGSASGALMEHRRGAARAGSMAIVQDDSHQGMGPWLQCVVLDESITAQLHDRQPNLSAEACSRLPPRAQEGKPSARRDKEAQDGSCS